MLAFFFGLGWATPMQFIFGKSIVPGSVTGDVFEGVRAVPMAYLRSVGPAQPIAADRGFPNSVPRSAQIDPPPVTAIDGPHPDGRSSASALAWLESPLDRQSIALSSAPPVSARTTARAPSLLSPPARCIRSGRYRSSLPPLCE